MHTHRRDSFHLKNWMDPFSYTLYPIVFSFPVLLLNISAASPFWDPSIGFTSYFYVVRSSGSRGGGGPGDPEPPFWPRDFFL